MKFIAIALIVGSAGAAGSAPAAPTTAIVSVPGLDCAAWPLTIPPALTPVRGVTGVRIDVDRRRVRVEFDDSTADLSEVIRALNRAGFAATVVRVTKATPG